MLRHSGKTYTAKGIGLDQPLKWVEGAGEETNCRTVVGKRLIRGGPNRLVVIIERTIHDGE